MNYRPLTLRILAALVLIAILTGCQSPTPAPTSAPQPTANLQATINAVQTQSVQTFTANLTQNAPTATRVLPTNTPAATATQAPTSTPPKPAGTATATQKPQPVGPTATTAIFCSVRSSSPNANSPVSPSATFTITWVVVNTGSQTWDQSQFAVQYWSGTRFTSQQKVSLPFEVVSGSDITIVTSEMTAPGNPGTYNAVWGVVKGFTPYCLMGVSVVVK